MPDLSIPKLLVLAVLALVIFGPDQLPKIASQAGRALRDLRQLAEAATNDLREGLGPELAGPQTGEQDPARVARKHLSGDPDTDQEARPARRAAANGTPLTPGQRPPSDPNAT